MYIKDIAKNFGYATAAQGASLLLSMILALIVPKVLGVEGYGYWQLFIFYGSYVGVFFFGLPDGIYLEKGGETRAGIDKVAMRSQFIVGMSMQVIFAGIVFLLGITTVPDADRLFVVLSTALLLILANAAVYLGIIFQTINETRLYSFSILLEKVAYVAFLVPLLAMHVQDFRCYILLFLAAKLITFIYCLFKGKEFVFGNYFSVFESVKATAHSMRVGIILTLANLGSMFTVGCSRLVVDSVWGIEAFGQASLAISLLNFFLVFISQLSMVLFPAMRQSGQQERIVLLAGLSKVLDVILPLVYILYIPAFLFVNMWLPQYREAATLLAILMPMVVFETKTNICYSTYFKVERFEKKLLSVNILSVTVSLILSVAMALTTNSVALVVCAAVTAVCLRGLLAAAIVQKKVNLGFLRAYLVDIVVAVVFTISAWFVGGILGFVIIVFLMVCLYIIRKQDVVYCLHRLFK